MEKLKLEIDGIAFAVDVQDDGMFAALYDGDLYKADSFAKLKKKLTARVRGKAARIAIPVTLLKDNWYRDREEFVDVEIVGRHSNGNLLLKSRHGTEQFGHGDSLMRRLEKSEEAEYRALLKNVKAATDARDAWRERHVVNGLDLLRKAQAEKGIDPEEP